MTQQQDATGTGSSHIKPPTTQVGLFQVSVTQDSSGRPVTEYRLLPAYAADKSLMADLRGLASIELPMGDNFGHATRVSPAGEFKLMGPHISGQTLPDYVRENGPMPQRSALNLMLGLAETLASVQRPHGALTPDQIVISGSGRVYTWGLGFSDILAKAASAKTIPSAYGLAPEVIESGSISLQGDVYSLGASLYLAATGKLYEPGSPPPSKLANVDEMFDRLAARCLDNNPANRPQLPQLCTALRAILSGQISQVAPRSSASEVSQPNIPSVDAPGVEKFLVTKGSLDYGPYSMENVLERITADDVLAEHSIMDSETGQRWKVGEHPLLSGAALQAKEKRDQRRRAVAEEDHAKVESTKKWILYASVVLVVAVLALVAVWVFQKAAPSEKKEAVALAGTGGGEFNIEVATPPKKKKTTKRRSRKRQAAAGLAGDDDDVDTLDMSSDLGDERLSDSQIFSVINNNSSALVKCGAAKVWMKIDGPSGKVKSVKVNGARSGSKYACISRVLKSAQFPKIDGRRTIASFNMGR